MKTVLVTGVAGFIGKRVCEILLDKGFFVVGIDNLNNYYDIRLKTERLSQLGRNQKSQNFKFFEVDIESRGDLEAIFDNYQFTTVYNIAARAGVRYSIENPDVYLSTNTLGTLNLLECMKKYGVQKFLLSSTSSLYAGQELPFDENLAVNTPISPYAATKKAAEALAYSYHHLYNIDVTVVRYFTVFGPLGRPDMCIFRFMKWIDEGREIELFGDGSQSRDFTFVDDVAEGTVLAGEAKLGYEVINIGGGNNPVSINNIISHIEESLGKPALIKNLPFHKADIKTTWAAIKKADELLGWAPKVSVKDGLNLTLEDFKRNIEFYRSISLP